jgi:hypothetical protein
MLRYAEINTEQQEILHLAAEREPFVRCVR